MMSEKERAKRFVCYTLENGMMSINEIARESQLYEIPAWALQAAFNDILASQRGPLSRISGRLLAALRRIIRAYSRPAIWLVDVTSGKR